MMTTMTTTDAKPNGQAAWTEASNTAIQLNLSFLLSQVFVIMMESQLSSGTFGAFCLFVFGRDLLPYTMVGLV